jgi:hypothetical protein
MTIEEKDKNETAKIIEQLSVWNSRLLGEIKDLSGELREVKARLEKFESKE